MKDGQVTIDEFFLQSFRSERFNVAIGRMQAKFVARGGVFSKSLDQNNSNNLRVNWTGWLACYLQSEKWLGIVRGLAIQRRGRAQALYGGIRSTSVTAGRGFPIYSASRVYRRSAAWCSAHST